MNSKNSEVEQPGEGHNVSKISYTKYIDLGTKDNPNIQNQLRVFYHTIKELQTIKDRLHNADV